MSVSGERLVKIMNTEGKKKKKQDISNWGSFRLAPVQGNSQTEKAKKMAGVSIMGEWIKS